MWKPEHRRAADRTGVCYPSDLSDAEWLNCRLSIPSFGDPYPSSRSCCLFTICKQSDDLSFHLVHRCNQMYALARAWQSTNAMSSLVTFAAWRSFTRLLIHRLAILIPLVIVFASSRSASNPTISVSI